MSKGEQSPYAQMIVLRDTYTGNRVAVNMLYVRAVEDTESGSVLTFSDGDKVTVDERFDVVMLAVIGSLPRGRRQRS